MAETIAKLLQKSKIDRRESELLLSHVLQKTREFIISHPKQKISKLQEIKYKALAKKRSRVVPIAYLTGNKEFYGTNFLVNKYVLIPRPETEMIVEEVLSILKNKDKTILIDVGTGSGCIPISVSSALGDSSGTTYKIFATDISRKAIRIAKKNAKKHKVKIEFLHGNLLQPIINKKLLTTHCSLLIVANLPYLTEDQYRSEPSIQHEPKKALVARNQGLALYEKLFKQVRSLISNHQSQITTIIEIDPSQSEAIPNLIKKYFPKTKIEIKKDLAELSRLVIFSIKKNLNK
ncbi:MAG: peptide chain release factor N(5)-glutamine methyltransferase [Candidatus Magasanikbacteria bacterium]|nr:peptide chain release factor N(5)-glutamine methyltransferase [Candidatus Magasanikbacteria bacterium]